MEKQQYARYMQAIIAHHKKEDAFYEVMDSFGCRFDSDIFDEYECMLVESIEDAMHDTENWTSYFLYERSGDLSKPCVWDKNDVPIDTSTWEKVYDLIQGRETE